MCKFTKGPWQILPEEVDKDYIRIRGTVLGGRYKVANVPTPTHEGVHPREVEETRANAVLIAAAPELIAAAPELFAALQAIADLPSHRQDECSVLAKAAIAKAKGGKA